MGEFDRPGFLALLLAIPLLVVFSRASLANLSRQRQLLAFGLRALLLFLIAIALAGPRWLLPVREPSVMFLVDESQSLGDPARQKAETFVAQALKDQPAGQRFAVLRFAKQVRIETGFSGETFPPTEPILDETCLTAAIRQSAALFPSGPGRLIVLSDGGETQFDPLPLQLPPNREMDVVSLPTDSQPDAWVENLSLPAQVREGESLNATVSVGSNEADREAEIALYQDGFLIERKSLQLRKGSQSVTFKNLHSDQSRSRFEAVVSIPEDAHPVNDRMTAAVTSSGQPRVLIVDPQPSLLEPLAGALRNEKMNVETRPPSALPTSLEELQAFDLVILSDTPISGLSSEVIALLQTWVKDFGGGLIVTGGENSFGAGGYFRTPLESLLPVRSEHPDKMESPVAALEVVLDRSGSMTAIVGGQTKMDLANQGAIMALNQLMDRDYFGVLAVDVRPQTVLPLGQPGDRNAAANFIRGIRSSGGGIYVYSALVDAYRQLRSVPAKVKHVILFADASDAEEATGPGGQKAEALSVAALAAGVTTSVVALGKESDKDVAFLRSLAQAGNGRFYLTDDATTLPQLFALEAMRATQSSLVEEPFIPEPGTSSVLAGLDWNAAPPLLGYNAVKLQPGAEALLTTPSGDPLLALWPVGLGNVAAFTSDVKSRWAGEWLNWPGFGKFWGQVARALLRENASAEFELSLSETDEAIQIHICSDREGQQFRVQASTSSGREAVPEVRQIAPGEFEAILAKDDAEDFSLSVSEVNGRGSPQFRSWTRSYSREFSHSDEGEARLRQLAQIGRGKWNPEPAEVWRAVAQPDFLPVNLTPYFLMAAILVFCLDLGNRRRPGILK